MITSSQQSTAIQGVCYNNRMYEQGVITIDGPAGAGKSTLGERLAQQLGYLFFDTGTMYRALAYAALQRALDVRHAEQMGALADTIDIDVLPPTVDDGRPYTVQIDGDDVTWHIRQPEVERAVSQAAAHPRVRELLRARQRAIGLRGGVVMVGRDIGSIVMPDAPYKIFLEASLDERARRRAAELAARGRPVVYDEVRTDIARRDAQDHHVMTPAPDAVVIRSDGLTPDEVIAAVLRRVSGAAEDP